MQDSGGVPRNLDGPGNCLQKETEGPRAHRWKEPEWKVSGCTQYIYGFFSPRVWFGQHVTWRRLGAGLRSAQTARQVAETTEDCFLKIRESGSPSSRYQQMRLPKGFSPYLAHGHLLSVSSHGLSLCMSILGVSSYFDRNTRLIGLEPHLMI